MSIHTTRTHTHTHTHTLTHMHTHSTHTQHTYTHPVACCREDPACFGLSYDKEREAFRLKSDVEGYEKKTGHQCWRLKGPGPTPLRRHTRIHGTACGT